MYLCIGLGEYVYPCRTVSYLLVPTEDSGWGSPAGPVPGTGPGLDIEITVVLNTKMVNR